jgi:hypothetical protein
MSDHPGYVIRRLRNDAGAPYKFPTLGIVLEAGDEADVVYAADQQVPHGFTQIGADVPCDEAGTPLTPPAETRASDTASAGADAAADKSKGGRGKGNTADVAASGAAASPDAE